MKTILILLSFLVSALGKDCWSTETDPVCGSDGTTYLNKCAVSILARDRPGLYVAHKGRCKPCKCDNAPIYPLCASDGYTYKNACQMICSNPTKDLAIEFPGFCGFKCDPYYYDPVCVSNGRTYGNKCLFAGVSKYLEATIVKNGTC